jgi:hypothetical protein
MTELFVISYAALRALVVAQLILTAVLARYVMGSTISSLDARTRRNGPSVGGRVSTNLLVSAGLDSSVRRDAIVVFLSSTCRPCSSARDVVSAFARNHERRPWISVVCDGPPNTIGNFLASLRGNVTTIEDSQGRIAKDWDIAITPFAVAVSADGRLRAKRGRVTEDDLVELSTVLRRRSPNVGRDPHPNQVPL